MVPEGEMGILQRTERSIERVISGAQLKDKKRYTDLMFMLCLNETIDQLAMTNIFRWYGCVLRIEDGHILRKEIDFEVECQRKKGRPKRTWKRQIEEESEKDCFTMHDVICRSKWSVDVNQIVAGLRSMWPASLVGNTTRF